MRTKGSRARPSKKTRARTRPPPADKQVAGRVPLGSLPVVRRLAVLSLHTSPLAQPGAGDGGGMNVYVRELTAALAGAGVGCDVYTRAWRPGLAPVVAAEAGVRVHHITAGPLESVSKESLVELLPEFTAGVKARMAG